MTLDPTKRAALKPGDAKFLEIIDKYGWHVMSVAPLVGEEGDCFSYSTGIYLRFNHPEILIVGLDPDTATKVINAIASRVKAGESFAGMQLFDGVFGGGMKSAFRPVQMKLYKDYVCWSQWFYEGSHFPVLQCFWPDNRGLFPWDPGCDPEVISSQPLLYIPGPDLM